MADILIRGMDKPHNCFHCDLSYLRGERLFCHVTKDEVLRSKIASDCPIQELPPHGDLISADDVQHVLDNLLKRTDDDAAIDFLKWAKDCVRVLPKIVPSNKEDAE